MDYRIDTVALLSYLGLTSAYVLRNAGGVVTEDVIRSLLMHWFKIVTVPEVRISVVTHTGCGMLQQGDDAIKKEMEADSRIAQSPSFSLETFPTPELGVRRSVQRLRSSPFVPAQATVRGFVYKIDKGLVCEVTTHIGVVNDTLPLVAANFNVTVDALREANPQIRSETIEPGQVLVIPLPVPAA